MIKQSAIRKTLRSQKRSLNWQLRNTLTSHAAGDRRRIVGAADARAFIRSPAS